MQTFVVADASINDLRQSQARIAENRLTAFAVHNQINPLFEAMPLAPLLSRTPKVLGKVLYTPAVNNYYPSF